MYSPPTTVMNMVTASYAILVPSLETILNELVEAEQTMNS